MYTNQQRTDIASRITEILDKRKPFIERLTSVEKHLKTLQSTLLELEKHRQKLIKLPDNAEIAGNLQQINFPGLLKRLEFQTNKLAQLHTRFDRGTLNIGVVGLMGQGKSTLLKSLSGLSDDEIPAREGGACTAVRSTVYHQNQPTYARVTFHDEDSFLKEVIGSYYEELRLAPKPKSLDEFASQLPELPSDAATKKAMYQRLRNEYYAHFNQYRHLLEANSPRVLDRVPKEEIRNYVVHQQEANSDFAVLAVREVEIFCPFSRSEVEKIALVDIPGLGDLRVGDENLMLQTLGERVDVVLFVRRPDSVRYGWEARDTKLYDTAHKALNDLPERSFMVLNKMSSADQDNSKGCETLKRTIRENHIEVVNCVMADCSNPGKANQVLELILDYLVNNIEDLDSKYAKAYQDHIDILHRDLDTDLQKASKALAGFGDEDQLFVERFKEFKEELSDSLEKFLKKLRKNRETVDPYFKAKVDTVMKACQSDSGIPALEEIERQRTDRFGGSYRSTYYGSIAAMRANLSKHFLSLNEGLQQSVEQLKSEVTNVLVNLKKGHLGNLTKERDAKFLGVMTELLDKYNNQLELGFRTLWESQVSYEGLIIHSIRQHFDDELEPDLINNNTLSITNSESGKSQVEEFNQQEVKNRLEALHKKVVIKCKQTLDQWLTEPSQVRYFIIGEFFDRIHYAKDIGDQWRTFLRKEEIRSKVWPEFQRLKEHKQIQQEWQNLLQKAISSNTLESMQFLN
ncbi:dynamin family protein [Moorena sp. SIO4G3]|uniref:dynamin family protein n=1 Tax=Moorena sp. SIO4G3 TaxID=2607821 RepID=UPI0014292379|nr:dynamin family protein [Moorena sp. SIO4G3]NEO81291.1 hypothetical protein [Moorena sp. SIO4G3]